MSFSMEIVKKLRIATGAGIMNCKKFLKEANGDYDKAIILLRSHGVAKIANKVVESYDGFIGSSISKNKDLGIIANIACETDFVAKNNEFINMSNSLIDMLLDNACYTLEDVNKNNTIQTFVQDMIVKFGESISIKSIDCMKSDKPGCIIYSYVHGGNLIGSMFKVNLLSSLNSIDTSKLTLLEECLKNIGMHIVAMNPMFLDKGSIDKNILEENTEIFKTQMKDINKPDKVKEMILKGKINNFICNNTLLLQKFIKDDTLTIDSYISSFSSKLGVNIIIESFVRIKVV